MRNLFLASKWRGDSAQIEAIKKMSGFSDFKGKKVFYCPTASNKGLGEKTWVIKSLQSLSDLDFKIDICDITGADAADIYERMKDADILFFDGGDTLWLLSAIHKSKVDTYLNTLLDDHIYIGISAGGCILSPYCYSSCDKWFQDTSEELTDGLGITDFQFIPHFESQYFPDNTESNLKNVKDKLAKINKKALMIDDSGSITYSDNQTDQDNSKFFII